MGDFKSILTVGFELIIALILFLTALYSFLHARKGEDISAVPFGVANLALLVSQIAVIIVLSMRGNLTAVPDYLLSYYKWHQGLSWLIYSMGVFFSIYLTGRLFSIISIPAMTLAAIFIGLGFMPSIFPTFPNFDHWGWFLWVSSAVMLSAASFMYFLFNVRRKERFRIMMSFAFFLLSISVFCLLNSENIYLSYASNALRFIGFGIVFYEVQTNYL